jgi:hypothetical protein
VNRARWGSSAVALLALAFSASALAQGPQVEVEASTFNTRIPFNPNESTEAWRFGIPGYRGLYCAASAGPALGQATNPAAEVFDFRNLLLNRMRTRDAAALRRLLDEAEKSSGREQQFLVLFGMALPPSAGIFQPAIYEGLPRGAHAQLQMGQEVTMSDLGTYRCLTPAQVDSSIAEAKRAYQAVIAGMSRGTLQAPRTRQ